MQVLKLGGGGHVLGMDEGLWGWEQERGGEGRRGGGGEGRRGGGGEGRRGEEGRREEMGGEGTQ